MPTADTLIRHNFVRSAGVDGISVGTETDNPVANTRIARNQVQAAVADTLQDQPSAPATPLLPT